MLRNVKEFHGNPKNGPEYNTDYEANHAVSLTTWNTLTLKITTFKRKLKEKSNRNYTIIIDNLLLNNKNKNI